MPVVFHLNEPVAGAATRPNAKPVQRHPMLGMQAQAGNRAVAGAVAKGTAVQREGYGDFFEPWQGGQGQSDQQGGSQQQTTGGSQEGGYLGDGSGYTEIPGVLKTNTIIADNVVASSYTPGAGNMY